MHVDLLYLNIAFNCLCSKVISLALMAYPFVCIAFTTLHELSVILMNCASLTYQMRAKRAGVQKGLLFALICLLVLRTILLKE